MAAAAIQSLQIMTCNVNGVKSKKDYIKHLDKDIYFIQETHLSKEEEREHLSNENYVTYHAHYTNPETGRSERGVAILIKKEISSAFKPEDPDSEDPDLKGRYLIVKGSYGGAELTLVNIYGPPKCDRPTFFENIFEKLKNSTNIIMGGDFNLIMDPVKDSANKTTRQRKQHSKDSIEKYMETYKLCDIWRQRNPEVQKYTYTVASRIDYFLVSNSLMEHNVTDNEILEESMSDHFPVLLKLQWDSDVFLKDPLFTLQIESDWAEFIRNNSGKIPPSLLWEDGKKFLLDRIQSYPEFRKKSNEVININSPASCRDLREIEQILKKSDLPELSQSLKKTKKEITDNLFNLENRPPGPDGLSVGFYKHFWKILSPILCRAVQEKINLLIPVENKEETTGPSSQSLPLRNTDEKIIAEIIRAALCE